jgi:site-specific recombinase XerD
VGTINRDWLLEQFEAYLSSLALASATVVNYMADLRAFFRWCEETEGALGSPFGLGTSDIRAYCSYLKETKNHASTTVNRRLQALRKFYDWAVAQRWILTNPAEDAPLLTEAWSGRSRSLTPEDVGRLLEAVGSGGGRRAARDWAIFQVLLGAGLKLGELIELRVADVHLDGSQPCLVVDDAGSSLGRKVPLEAEVCDALNRYLDARQAGQDVDHLFVNRDGNPLSTRSVQRLLHHYGRAAGLGGLTTQALRYVYATRLYDRCGDLEVVARRLGHRHLATTIRYLRPDSED